MKKSICVITVFLVICVCFASCSDKKTSDKEITETVTKQAKIPKNDSINEDETVKEQNDVDTKTEEAENISSEQPVQSDTNPSKSGAKGEINLSEVRSSMLRKEGIEDAMLLDGDAMSNLYGIDKAIIKQAAGFVTMSGTFPHEIIMIEANNSANASTVESALKTRLEEVMNQAKSYDAENYELALQCKVHKNGNYVSLFLSPGHAEMTNIYNEYVK